MAEGTALFQRIHGETRHKYRVVFIENAPNKLRTVSFDEIKWEGLVEFNIPWFT